jgi:hypothetical protein
VEETGRNSVIPSITANITAWMVVIYCFFGFLKIKMIFAHVDDFFGFDLRSLLAKGTCQRHSRMEITRRKSRKKQ